jgi:hypothetical protein
MQGAPTRTIAVWGLAFLTVALTCGKLQASPISQLTSSTEFSVPATKIGFDGFPNGTVANNLFLDQQVSFQRDDGFSVFINDWQSLGRGTTSPPNVLATISGSLFGFVTHLNVLFAAPVFEVGAFFGNDQMIFGGFPSMTLSVYDAVGRAIGSVTVATNNNTNVDQFIGLRSEIPFARARFENNQTNTFAVVVDDIIFSPSQPVPEPSTLGLLSFGALAVFGWDRYRSLSTHWGSLFG